MSVNEHRLSIALQLAQQNLQVVVNELAAKCAELDELKAKISEKPIEAKEWRPSAQS